MRRFLLGAALALGLAAPASAGTVIDVTGYNLPDANAFGVLTTDGYSYYTGPIQLVTSVGLLDVYCADLAHVLHTGQYEFSVLTQDGKGNAISALASHRLGALAGFGLKALALGGVGNLNIATAAQAAIWDLEYSTTSIGSATLLGIVAGLLADAGVLNGIDRAVALIPYGQGWSGEPSASQQMIVGQAAVPEPASMAILGAGLVGLGALRRKRV